MDYIIIILYYLRWRRALHFALPRESIGRKCLSVVAAACRPGAVTTARVDLDRMYDI